MAKILCIHGRICIGSYFMVVSDSVGTLYGYQWRWWYIYIHILWSDGYGSELMLTVADSTCMLTEIVHMDVS